MKLVIFDVDGTLIDSQAHIVGAMQKAFVSQDMAPPERAAVLSIIGLSVPEAIAQLAPNQDAAAWAALSRAFKSNYSAMSGEPAITSSLFPGARHALETLAARTDLLLAVATGNSQRGLAHLMELHGLEGVFASRQTADGHPSKPNPSMIETCLAETGVARRDAIMIGDTVFDMQMAVAAGVTGLGVSWGYHGATDLHQAGAQGVLDQFDALVPWLDAHWRLT